MSDAHLQEWGWRVAFGVGAVLAFGVYVLRMRLAETESFNKLGKDRARSSMLQPVARSIRGSF